MVSSLERTRQGDDICKEFRTCVNDSVTSNNRDAHTILHIEESPRFSRIMDQERQISVDPMSLKQSAKKLEDCERYSFIPPLTPAAAAPKDSRLHSPLPYLLPPVKFKFVTNSLPSSATSSPRSGSILMNLKKWRTQGHRINSLARQYSSIVSPFTSQGSLLRKSKSCSEGRASIMSDEFDMWSINLNKSKHESAFSGNYHGYDSYEANGKNIKESNSHEDNFKCGACLYLPGFSKGKPVRRPRKEEGEEVANVISRTVSLEKFECGSWASSSMSSNDEEKSGSVSLYFDLPLELIRNNVNDAYSPVATAFVFERDRKGVLKKNTSRGAAGKPIESPRHVRFSTSNPMSHPASPCISPRLRKARDDFNAYLEAGV